MKRTYTRPSVSPSATPTGYDCSTLAWMDRTGLGFRTARPLWDALGDMLDTLCEADTLVYLSAEGRWTR